MAQQLRYRSPWTSENPLIDKRNRYRKKRKDGTVHIGRTNEDATQFSVSTMAGSVTHRRPTM
jgi:hypothetical protein